MTADREAALDRFICRREGHIPAGKLTGTGAVFVTSYVTTCVRCGKVFEVVPDTKAGS